MRFKAVGSAPILKQQVYKISAAQRFETVVKFLRAKLKCGPRESVFCYVNSVFAPGLDEVVGNLFKVRPVLEFTWINRMLSDAVWRCHWWATADDGF